MMKSLSVLIETNESERSRSPLSSEQIAARLHAAEHRLSKPERSPVRIVLRAVSDDFDSPANAEDPGPVSDSQSIDAFPILIEAAQGCDLDSKELLGAEVNIISSISIYNLAISYLCQAKASDSTISASELRATAVRVLSLAYTLLSMADDDNEESMDWLRSSRLVFVSITILKTLTQVLIQSGRTSEAKQCLSRLRYLGGAAKELYGSPLLGRKSKVAAAA